MKGYYNNEEATNEVLKDGWLLTGDMGRQDEDGFIYLVDRKKDVIVCGGENLYPVEIEDFLMKNDAIKDVAVIGLPDKRLGEIEGAIIEVKEGMTLTEDEVNEFCLQLPDLIAERLLCYMQTLGCASEMQLFGDGNEIL